MSEVGVGLKTLAAGAVVGAIGLLGHPAGAPATWILMTLGGALGFGGVAIIFERRRALAGADGWLPPGIRPLAARLPLESSSLRRAMLSVRHAHKLAARGQARAVEGKVLSISWKAPRGSATIDVQLDVDTDDGTCHVEATGAVMINATRTNALAVGDEVEVIGLPDEEVDLGAERLERQTVLRVVLRGDAERAPLIVKR